MNFLSHIARTGAAIALLAASTLTAQQRRMVFAHYMVTNQDYQGDDDPTQEKKIAAYEREIQQAQALGIDGFALNVGGWLRQPYYIRYSAQMFEAAVRLHTGFKLMFSADMCCGNTMDDVRDMMRRFAGNPRYAPVYFQQDGKFVLTTFAGDKLGPTAWVQMRIDLLRGASPSTTREPIVLAAAASAPSNAPLRTFFVPAFFWGGETPDKTALESAVNLWGPAIDGAFYWGIAGVPGNGKALDNAKSSAAYAQVLHKAHKLYMAPVALQFWGANADRYFEYSGTAGMRSLWRAAVENKADWVEIITWNDFIEGTYVSPIDDPNKYDGANFLDGSGIPKGTLGYFHSRAAFGDLLRYFIAWYKAGEPPEIAHDQVFFFYRTQLANTPAHSPSVSHRYGPVADRIYITAQLTAPATLVVHNGDKSTTEQLPAGSHDISVPAAAGPAPQFELRRNGNLVLRGEASDAIEATPKYNNFLYATGELTAP